MPTPSRPLHGILFACFDAGVKVASAIASVGLVVWTRYMFQVWFTALTVLPRHGTALLLRGLSLLAFFSLQVKPCRSASSPESERSPVLQGRR
jgi:hypothetical protein